MRPRQESKKGSSNGSINKISSTTTTTTTNNSDRYRECRKNHAANIGGYAVDGCREFMASGEEGTSASLKCAACTCHRNFHRREVADQNDESQFDCSSNS